jgi:transcriptional antiterminator NusG
MIFTYRVTGGQELIVADLLEKKIMKSKIPVKSIIISPNLKGYVIIEGDDFSIRQAANGIPQIKGVLRKEITIEELKTLVESKPLKVDLQKGSMIEITSGPFKGEKAKVVKFTKEDVVVELMDVAVPIPVTIKSNTIKLI